MPEHRLEETSESVAVGPVAFCLPALAGGGMEQVTLTLIQAFIAHGHATELVLERRQGAYLDRLPADCDLTTLTRSSKWQAVPALIRCHMPEGLRQMAGMIVPGLAHLPLGRLSSLVAYFRANRPRVFFVAHGRMPLLALWARDIAGVATRVVIVEHSTLSRWLVVFANQPPKQRRWAYRVALARRLYPRADAIVAVSDGVADDLAATLALPRRPIRTIYNPIDIRAISERMKTPVTDLWFENGAPPVILSVGRLVEEKNFPALIEAFAIAARRSDFDARLIIVGEGEAHQALLAQIAALGLDDRVRLAGWQDNPHALMHRSAMLVMSSLFEGLGMVLIEAMACGCPVVSVDCPSGPAEILAHGRYGRLVPMHAPEALAAAMIDTLSAPRRSADLMLRAEDFSVDAAYAGYRRLIDDLLSPDLQSRHV